MMNKEVDKKMHKASHRGVWYIRDDHQDSGSGITQEQKQQHCAALWLNTFSGFQRHVFFTGLLYNFAADNSSPQAWIYSPVEMTLPQAFSQSTMEMKGDNGVLSTRLEIQWLFNKLQQW